MAWVNCNISLTPQHFNADLSHTLAARHKASFHGLVAVRSSQVTISTRFNAKMVQFGII